MRLKLVSVGKVKDPGLRAAVDEYLKRLKRHHEIQWVEVRKESAERSVEEICRLEGERLLAAAGEGVIVVLDEKGDLVDSRKFSERLRKWADTGVRDISFLIGGAYGHAPEVKKRAAWTWSLSPLTLTHQHVPMLVAEQIYRAGTIQRGEPYHND